MSDSSVVLQDGVSYGPAMSRRTRTPISFQEGSSSLNGQFAPGNPLQNLVSLLPMLQRLKPTGNITIYPKSPENAGSPGNIGKTIRHEDIHALISQLQTDPTADATLPPGSFNSLAPYIKNRSGNPVNEIPAYASEPGTYPEDKRQAFIQQMVAQLSKSNPKAAQIYQSLTQGK